MYEIASKVELNVFDGKFPPIRIGEFVVKNQAPAIVVPPELVAPFIVDRSNKRGFYKIIAAVDFPHGSKFAMQKVRDMGRDALAADGFDILLSLNKTTGETFNEVKSVTEFLKSLNQVAEIRWTLPHYTPVAKIADFLNAVKRCPQVTWIRLGHLLTDSSVTLGHYNGLIQMMKQAVPLPIKIGGNVTSETFDALSKDKAFRFDVTLDQVNALIRAKEKPVERVEAPVEPPKEVAAETKISEVDGEKVTGALGQDVV